MPENTSYNVDSGNESEQITRLFEVGVIVLKFDPIANTRFEKRPSGYLGVGLILFWCLTRRRTLASAFVQVGSAQNESYSDPPPPPGVDPPLKQV